MVGGAFFRHAAIPAHGLDPCRIEARPDHRRLRGRLYLLTVIRGQARPVAGRCRIGGLQDAGHFRSENRIQPITHEKALNVGIAGQDGIDLLQLVRLRLQFRQLLDKLVQHVGLDAVIFQHPPDLRDLLRDGLGIDGRHTLRRDRRG